RLGVAGRGLAGQAWARHGWAGTGLDKDGALQGIWSPEIRQVSAESMPPSMASRGEAVARCGLAGPGLAGRGVARLGRTRRGLTGQGRTGQRIFARIALCQ